MIHHYIQKGHHHNDLLELNSYEKAFYKASMVIDKEEKREEQGTLINRLVSHLIGKRGR